MADEVMREEEFPCPCGKGVLLVEVLEHDTWVSGRHTRATMRCGECAKSYRHDVILNAYVLREHYEEKEARERAIYQHRGAVGDLAAARYLPQFGAYVRSLKFKTAMHDAIGGYSSIQKFRDATRYGDGLDRAIEHGLRERPVRALARIGVEDTEIAAELAAIAEEEAAVERFVKEIPRYTIPDIDR